MMLHATAKATQWQIIKRLVLHVVRLTTYVAGGIASGVLSTKSHGYGARLLDIWRMECLLAMGLLDL